MKKMMKSFLLIGLLAFFLSGCIMIDDTPSIYPSGLTVEFDKTISTDVGYQNNAIYFYNIVGESITKVQAKMVYPTFDDHNPYEEPDWTNVSPLVRADNPSRSDIPNNSAVYLKLDSQYNLYTVFFKITSSSGKSCVFAVIPENNMMWRVQVRKANTES